MELLIDDPDLNASDMLTAKAIAEKLHEKYPGHLWGVNVAHGVADIRNLYLAGNWGYRLIIPKIYSSSDLDARVVRAGGEILERFKLSRGAANDAELMDLKVGAKGLTVGDYAR